jgi:hypothetical protein
MDVELWQSCDFTLENCVLELQPKEKLATCEEDQELTKK